MPGKTKEESSTTWDWIFQGFFVDFLGKLMPGFFFLVFSTTALFPTVYVIIRQNPEDSCGMVFFDNFQKLSAAIDAMWPLIVIGAVFLSYTFGHLFYRMEIKVPDRVSFLWLKIKSKFTGENPASDFACTTFANCEFPYPYIANYLHTRGFDHLIGFVRWKQEKRGEAKNKIKSQPEELPQDGKTKWRSRKYVDILKIRIFNAASANSPLVRNIVRNEAHVRLSSSIWYASMYLLLIATLGIVTILFIGSHHENISIPGVLAKLCYRGPLMAPVLVMVISLICLIAVTGFLHGLRIRELFYILEIAYDLYCDEPEKLQYVFPEFSGSNPNVTNGEDST